MIRQLQEGARRMLTSEHIRLWPRVTGSRRRGIVLCYHSIHPSKSFASATPKLFEDHLRWLKVHCEVVRFSQVREAVQSSAGSHPVVAITFDDGHADNYEYAFPLLQKHAIPATFFVTVGLLEKDPAVVQRFQLQRQACYEDIRPLEWSQVRDMCKAGMELGSHTYSHPNLARLERPAARMELRRSKEVMEQRLGQSIVLLAYPYGKPKRHFTAETECLVAESGYKDAAAILFRAVRSSDSRLAMPRFFATGDSLTTLEGKVNGDWDFLGWWQERAPLAVAKLVAPADFIS